ncbi:MAG: pre-peptidase C-terminal domain-containing protein [Nostoc sp.]|uniref:pre-peptidase C-terminal domain-containing protein n=1 Tax=Nostoc sp. TaxID=1180 RepID=UPI002FF93CED
MSIQYLGSLGSTARQYSSFNVNAADPTDIYRFSIGSNRNINLSLNNITYGGDADLRLYRDANNNGVLDSYDRTYGYVASSTKSSNADDAINVKANAGTYFAEVYRYAGGLGGNGYVFYDLDLSATTRASTADYSNLLPKEFVVGNLTSDTTRYGYISDSNTADVYNFSLGLYKGVSISLTGLSSDADIRLIRDYNNNRVVDAGEEVARSTRGGSTSELIANIDQSGDYFLQVNQYLGNTSYAVTFDQYNTPYA